MRLWLGWLGTSCTQTQSIGAGNKPAHREIRTTLFEELTSDLKLLAKHLVCSPFHAHVDGCRTNDRGLAVTLFGVRRSVEFWAAGAQVLWRWAQVGFMNKGEGSFGWKAAHAAVKGCCRSVTAAQQGCSTRKVSADVDAELCGRCCRLFLLRVPVLVALSQLPLYPTSSFIWAVKFPSLLFYCTCKGVSTPFAAHPPCAPQA